MRSRFPLGIPLPTPLTSDCVRGIFPQGRRAARQEALERSRKSLFDQKRLFFGSKKMPFSFLATAKRCISHPHSESFFDPSSEGQNSTRKIRPPIVPRTAKILRPTPSRRRARAGCAKRSPWRGPTSSAPAWRGRTTRCGLWTGALGRRDGIEGAAGRYPLVFLCFLFGATSERPPILRGPGYFRRK